MRRLQLQRRARLQGDGQVLQGARGLRLVVLLRRVQPHQRRGALGDRAADPHDQQRQEARPRQVPLRGHVHEAQPERQPVHHDEPGLRGARRAARQPQGALPAVRDDGARLRAHRRDPAVLVRLRERALERAEARARAPALLGAAEQPEALRLRHARGQLDPRRVRQPAPEARRRPAVGRGEDRAALGQRREPAQVHGRGPAALSRHHVRPLPGRRAAARRPRRAHPRDRRGVPRRRDGRARAHVPARPDQAVHEEDRAAVRDGARAPRRDDRRPDHVGQDGRHSRARVGDDALPRPRRPVRGRADLHDEPQVDQERPALRQL